VAEWLFEGNPAVYITLAALGLVLALAWWTTRRGAALVGVALVALLALTYFALDRLVLTDNEQVEQSVRTMAAGVRGRDVNQILDQVSESFRLGTLDKAAFRSFVDGALRGQLVDDLEVWDFEFPGGPSRTATREVVFRVKPKGGRAVGAFYLCKAHFVRDPDGKLRMQTLQVFNPAVDSNQPVDIPGLGR
jgi:hypothetical protein